MDTIEFRLSAFNYTDCITQNAFAHIFINGKNFSDMLYEFEKREGLKIINHAPISVAELHENLSEKYKIKSVKICSQLITDVETVTSNVVWKNFVLPHAENYTKNFGEFVFDKAQYFREVEKLKRWRFNDKLIIEYGSIDCGFVDFNFIKSGKLFNFAFDELLSDPLPQLVNLFVHIRRGEPCTENFGDTYDDRIKVLKISVRPVEDEIFLTAEIVKKKILLTEIYRREELAAMFKKFFDARLNDKYFPYSYPCFCYLSESDVTDEVLDAIEDAHPDWTTGDVWNYAVETGQLKLAPRHEKYLEHYKKMLTEFIIPDKWFE